MRCGLPLLALLVLLAGGCPGGTAVAPRSSGAAPAAATGKTPMDWDGREWVLVSYGAPAAFTEVPKDVRIMVRFESGKVSGSAGCNRFNGGYQLVEGELSITPLAATKMACREPAASLERMFLGTLEAASGARIVGDRLVIDSGTGVLTFLAAPDAGLRGSAWTVTAFHNGAEAVVNVLAGTQLTVEFDDAFVAGSSGCNTFRGPFTLEGELITIGPLLSTEMRCAAPESRMDQERRFLAALASSVRWSVSGADLALRGKGGELAIAARKQ